MPSRIQTLTQCSNSPTQQQCQLFCRISKNLDESYGLQDCISNGTDRHDLNATLFTTQVGTDIVLNQNRPALIVSSTSCYVPFELPILGIWRLVVDIRKAVSTTCLAILGIKFPCYVYGRRGTKL